eukprot:766730-Hanusia_phi.AAC.4
MSDPHILCSLPTVSLVGNAQEAAEEVERCASGAQVSLLDRDRLREHVGAMARGGPRVLKQQLQVSEEGLSMLVIALYRAVTQRSAGAGGGTDRLSGGSARRPSCLPPL